MVRNTRCFFVAKNNDSLSFRKIFLKKFNQTPMLFCFFLSFIGCYLSFHDTLFVMARSCCRYTVYEDGGAYDIGICPGQTLEAIRL